MVLNTSEVKFHVAHPQFTTVELAAVVLAVVLVVVAVVVLVTLQAANTAGLDMYVAGLNPASASHSTIG